MSVLDNHFYTGHGMSIGSETVGQAYLLVDGLDGGPYFERDSDQIERDARRVDP